MIRIADEEGYRVFQLVLLKKPYIAFRCDDLLLHLPSQRLLLRSFSQIIPMS